MLLSKGELMRRAVAALLCGMALLIGAPGAALSHDSPEFDCHFVLGFKAIRDLIGDGIVGTCLENEQYSANGDSVQQTTGGLLVWRKADNWTAFTDGYRTWVNGPYGLQQRLNSERFAWESDYGTVFEHDGTPALTPDALRNAEYVFAGRRVRLQNGELVNDLEVGSASETWVLHDPIAFGDLNGDGLRDAAVVLSYSGGGSGTFFYLFAVLNRNGAPVPVGSRDLGDRVRVMSLEISNGNIILMMVAHGPDDGLCCPTQDTVAYFHLHGNDLALESIDPPGFLIPDHHH